MCCHIFVNSNMTYWHQTNSCVCMFSLFMVTVHSSCTMNLKTEIGLTATGNGKGDGGLSNGIGTNVLGLFIGVVPNVGQLLSHTRTTPTKKIQAESTHTFMLLTFLLLGLVTTVTGNVFQDEVSIPCMVLNLDNVFFTRSWSSNKDIYCLTRSFYSTCSHLRHLIWYFHLCYHALRHIERVLCFCNRLQTSLLPMLLFCVYYAG